MTKFTLPQLLELESIDKMRETIIIMQEEFRNA